ncbi:MAG: glutamate synthase central domain-containing protein, partial [Solirubrobacteraceae bacterium]
MNKIHIERPNMDNTLYNQNYEHDNCGAGFVCSLNGEKSNVIIHKALQILERLEHRGAVSADGRTGDGAGVMIDIPHDFFVKACPEIKFPNQRDYAVGMVFLPKKINQVTFIKEKFNKLLISRGLELLGWREVPVVSEQLGVIAQRTEPTIQQIFVKKPDGLSDLDFRKKLFIVRKELENKIWNSKLSEKDFFYLPSFSNKTIVYKGLIRPDYMSDYYIDLKDADLTTRMALVHQRFSTNTFPSWDLAHPFRYLCHNGEINTLRGNLSKMRSREELFKNDNFFGQDVSKMLPIIKEGKSDSASMDMVVELMLLTGRTLPEVMMMMVPEAWEKDKTMPQDKKDFYLFNSCIMEPWDGPASIPFTDGDYLGALLDRNGLRPSRYSVTKDRYVIMSSETGVLDLEPENILYHGRLEPGKMFLVDMNKGLIVEDYEIKKEITGKQNWKNFIDNNLVELKDLPEPTVKTPIPFLDLFTRKKLFGFTEEQIQSIVHPMLEKGKEPMGSMGMDTPLAVLSEKPQLLFNYFKQLFAQVTNPPLDGIREEIITDISMVLGADTNIFENSEKHCNKLRILNPILSNDELNRIKSLNKNGLKSVVIPTLYEHGKGTEELQQKLDRIVESAVKEIDDGASIIILSDRGATPDMAPIPSLLVCSYVHHSLNKFKKRSQCDIIIESGEPREIHHYACLFGYGASAICPFLLYEILEEEIKSDQIKVKSFDEAVKNYQKAVKDGVVKVMNKIGISTLRSYHSAQIFEILGLSKDLSEKYFPYTSSRIKGIGILQLHKEILMRVEYAFPKNINQKDNPLEIGGEYRWRRNGEEHMFNPITVAKLQQAVRQNKPIVYKEYSDLINEQSNKLMTIRGLLDFTKHDPIPIDEVQPWTDIVKKFKTGAMSYGSISKEAHENLAIAMNRIGGKSNSGEGGEFADRFQKDINGDWRNSAIKQVASGRFGVTSN